MPVLSPRHREEAPMARKDELIRTAIERNPRIVDRFWAYVERDESEEGCWLWRGPLRRHRSPAFSIGSRSVSPARVAWYAATGEVVHFGRLIQMCGNDLCVRPSHLGWSLSRIAERHVVARDDGYVGIPGAVVEYPRH